MKITVNGRNIELTDALKDHVTEKLSKLQQHYDFLTTAEVFLSVDKNPSIKDASHAEATLHANGSIIRVSIASPDMYRSVDELTQKLERSLRKHKTKLLQRSQGRHHAESIRKPDEAETDVVLEDEEDFEIFEVETSSKLEEDAPALTP